MNKVYHNSSEHKWQVTINTNTVGRFYWVKYFQALKIYLFNYCHK